MIAHNKTELENLFLVNEAKSLYKASFITKEHYNQIASGLPIPKSQKNLLFRLFFAFLGCFLYTSICGFLSLSFMSVFAENYKILVFVYAIIGFAGAEFFVRQKQYRYGIEDAFITGGQFVFTLAVGLVCNNNLIIAIAFTLISFISYLRYVNSYSVLFFCGGSSVTIAFALFELGSTGKTILPFVMMVYGILLYFWTKKISVKFTFPFYHRGQILVNAFSLLLFYFSGNYLVVRKLSEMLLNIKITSNEDIPFALFFNVFTIIVPLLYIGFGLKQHNRIYLWIGFVTFGFSIYTIRYYHAILPVEIALTLGGLVLFALSYFCIKKLKDKTTGITFQPDRFIDSSDFMHTEALILTSQFGLKPEEIPQSKMEFGDGDFSGGGSGGTF